MIKYIILPEINLLIEYYYEDVSFDDILQHKKKITQDPLFNLIFFIVSDYRDCNLNVDVNDIDKYIKFRKYEMPIRGDIYASFLTSKPNQVVIGVLFKTISDDIGVKSHVCSTLRSGVLWIYTTETNYERIKNELELLKKS